MDIFIQVEGRKINFIKHIFASYDLRLIFFKQVRTWEDLGGAKGAMPPPPPQTPEVALCPMHYSLTVANYASLNPLSIQY